MSGQIVYDERKVNDNALAKLNTTADYLKEAVSNLEGINVGDLEIDLKTDEIKSNINGNISTINQIKSNIMDSLDDYIKAGIDSEQLIDEMFGDNLDNEEKISDGKTSIFGKLIDIGKSFLTTDLNSKTTEIKNKFDLWKKGIEYTVNKKQGIYGYSYYIVEPENPDPNIPTVFCFDGAAGSKFNGTSAGKIKEFISKDGKVGNDELLLPFGFLSEEGLENPNIRFIYIPNPTEQSGMHALETDRFYNLMDKILEDNPQIDQDNMSIMGHSARWKGRSTIF